MAEHDESHTSGTGGGSGGLGSSRGRAVPYLRAWRMHRALTLTRLAELAGVNLSTIARGERLDAAVGQPTLPMSWESIRRVARALDIRPDQLWTERPPSGDVGG